MRKGCNDKITEKGNSYLNAIRNAGDGIIITDINGNVVFINYTAEKLTGWNEKEAQGKHICEVLKTINKKTREDYVIPVKDVLKELVVTGLKKNTALISRDGEEKYISASISPVIEKENTVCGVIIVFREITKLVEVEEQVEKLSTIIEQSTALVLLLNLSGTITYSNNRSREILGYKRQELEQENIYDLSKRKILKNEIIDIFELAAKGEAWIGEVFAEKKNGEYCWLYIRAFPIKEENEEIKAVSFIITDVSKVKKTEHNLRLITDNMLDLICMTDMEGNIKYLSPSNIKILGINIEERINQSIFSFIYHEDVKKVRDLFSEILNSSGEFKKEIQEISVRFAVCNPADTYEKAIRLCRVLSDELGLSVLDMRAAEVLDFDNEVVMHKSRKTFEQKKKKFFEFFKIPYESISEPLHCGTEVMKRLKKGL